MPVLHISHPPARSSLPAVYVRARIVITTEKGKGCPFPFRDTFLVLPTRSVTEAIEEE